MAPGSVGSDMGLKGDIRHILSHKWSSMVLPLGELSIMNQYLINR